jgi:signal transduction histidine kinase
LLSAPLSVDPDLLSCDERQILESLACKVRAARSLDEVMNYLFETTRPICPCDRIGLALLEEDGQHLVARWLRSDYEPVLLGSGYAEDLADTSLGEVIRRGQPRIIDDLLEYHRTRPRSRSAALLLREGVRSSMTCPLQVDGRNIGLLFRSSRHARAYDLHQMHLHLAIADHLGLAVERAYHTDQLVAAKNAYLEVLGFVSHELRGPLTAMSLSADTLAAGLLGELKAEQKVQIQRIGTNARYMATMIQQYLDLARLDSDHLQLWTDDDVDFAKAVLEPTIEMLRPQLEGKRMRLAVKAAGPRSAVECDSELLKVVLVNLLGNAIKYGSPGGLIEVRWGTTREGFECAVWNDGPGFPPTERSRLFRRFSRLHCPALLRERGSGIGLYNVWRVVRMHGGWVSARSEPGKWAEFAFRLPQPIPSSKESNASVGDVPVRDLAADAARAMDRAQELIEEVAPAASRPSLRTGNAPPETGKALSHAPGQGTAAQRRPRVLCIDDDPEFSETVAHRLRTHDIDVVRAFDGTQGYWTALRERPDVILLDLTMPEGEGNYVFARLRSHPLTEKIPVIVVTGQANPAVKREFLSLGVSGYLVKPLEWQQLMDELGVFIRVAGPADAAK